MSRKRDSKISIFTRIMALLLTVLVASGIIAYLIMFIISLFA